jgi:hypothetical protein
MLRDHFAIAHAVLLRFGSARGQGTIEYVGLMLLMSLVLAAVVKAGGDADGAGIKELIVKKVKGAIDSVGDPKKG